MTAPRSPPRSEPANSQEFALGRIVAQADAAVLEEACEDVDALEHVAHGFGHFVVARELGPLPFHPLDEIVDQRGDLFLSHGKALSGRQSIDRSFRHEDGIELLHGNEGDRRDDG